MKLHRCGRTVSLEIADESRPRPEGRGSHSHWVRLSTIAGLAVLLAMTACARPTSEAVGCDTVRVPVTASAATGPTQLDIAGELCRPPDGFGATVELLIPGSTYNHGYWDFPAPSYSYARAHAARGLSTLAIDRPNTGASSRIDPAALTVELDASLVHQIVTALRAGQVAPGHAFTSVVSVGHSLGSVIAMAEAATYHDTDAVIVSGVTHSQNRAVQFARLVQPASQPDPSPSPFLKDKPAGTVTTLPGARGQYFYDPTDADPHVVAADEASKDTVSIAESAGFAPTLTGPASGQITVPVLLAVGQRDRLFTCGQTPCTDDGTLRTAEADRFGATTSFQAFVLPGSGHDMNLASNHQQFYDLSADWVEHHVPARS